MLKLLSMETKHIVRVEVSLKAGWTKAGVFLLPPLPSSVETGHLIHPYVLLCVL